jgi:hypothetical protein
MTWKDDLAEQMRTDAEAMFANLPEGEGPGDDDELAVGLGPSGRVLTMHNKTTGDTFTNVGGETVRTRPLSGGLLMELSVWRGGKMVHLEKRRRKAGKRPQVND